MRGVVGKFNRVTGKQVRGFDQGALAAMTQVEASEVDVRTVQAALQKFGVILGRVAEERSPVEV